MKKKILVIGNYNDAIYHSLAGVDKRLTSILSDYELICTDDTSKLLTLEEDQISGIISYQAGLWTCPDRDHLPHCHPLHSGLCKGSRHHRPPYPSGRYAGICQGGYYGKGAG